MDLPGLVACRNINIFRKIKFGEKVGTLHQVNPIFSAILLMESLLENSGLFIPTVIFIRAPQKTLKQMEKEFSTRTKYNTKALLSKIYWRGKAESRAMIIFFREFTKKAKK